MADVDDRPRRVGRGLRWRQGAGLENAGNRMSPNLDTREVYEHAIRRPTSLAPMSRAVVQSVGSGRSAMEQTDWHDQEEQRFLAKLAARLDKAVLAARRSR